MIITTFVRQTAARALRLSPVVSATFRTIKETDRVRQRQTQHSALSTSDLPCQDECLCRRQARRTARSVDVLSPSEPTVSMHVLFAGARLGESTGPGDTPGPVHKRATGHCPPRPRRGEGCGPATPVHAPRSRVMQKALAGGVPPETCPALTSGFAKTPPTDPVQRPVRLRLSGPMAHVCPCPSCLI
jgi:hypothetical protein